MPGSPVPTATQMTDCSISCSTAFLMKTYTRSRKLLSHHIGNQSLYWSAKFWAGGLCLFLTSSCRTSKVRAQIISPLLHSVVPEVCTSCLVRSTPLLTRVWVALLKVTLHRTCKSSKALNRRRKSVWTTKCNNKIATKPRFLTKRLFYYLFSCLCR